MNKSNYTVPIESGMHVRHDALARFTVKSGRKHLQDELMSVTLLGGAYTVACYTYNAIIGGGVSWWNPVTGKSIARPAVTMKVRPEDVLTDGEECGCAECVKASASNPEWTPA